MSAIARRSILRAVGTGKESDDLPKVLSSSPRSRPATCSACRATMGCDSTDDQRGEHCASQQSAIAQTKLSTLYNLSASSESTSGPGLTIGDMAVVHRESSYRQFPLRVALRRVGSLPPPSSLPRHRFGPPHRSRPIPTVVVQGSRKARVFRSIHLPHIQRNPTSGLGHWIR